jgi:protein required for attachment to host cells
MGNEQGAQKDSSSRNNSQNSSSSNGSENKTDSLKDGEPKPKEPNLINGKYKVIKIIGQGAFGQVLLVKDKKGVEYALKQVRLIFTINT